MADDVDVPRELSALDADLKRLEAEYNMYFAGRLPRPPWEMRAKVEAAVKRLDRLRAGSSADRFRFSTLQARLATFTELWDRALRAREEGRPGPFSASASNAAPPAPRPAADRVVHVATLSDPAGERDKLQELYDRLSSARRDAGQEPIAFDRFADLIRQQHAMLREQGSGDVAFRVAMKDGKVALTARPIKKGAGGG